MPKYPDYPYLLYSTPDGEIKEDPRYQAVSYGDRPLEPGDLTRLPRGASLALMPERRPLGIPRAFSQQARAGKVGAPRPLSRAGAAAYALAALLPIGYTRTLLPGYILAPGAEPLPFFGYAAVAGYRGQVYVAAVQTDALNKWHPDQYDPASLARQVKKTLAHFPENRVYAHHAHCALDYQCPTASNLFFERWEGAIAVSAGCNARCIGCISKQDEGLVSPQDRLTFVPAITEIVEVAVAHLDKAAESIISFGQGCEGEPLLQAGRIAAAIRKIRSRTDKGSININTNASNPRLLQLLIDAGLDSMRASTISADPLTYTAYYRPQDYTFADVKTSLIRAREAGVYTSINFLVFPGLADTPGEIAAMVAFLRETGVRLVQLRNLNIDPELLSAQLPARGEPLGIPTLLATLRRELPGLEIGNYSRPARRTAIGE